MYLNDTAGSILYISYCQQSQDQKSVCLSILSYFSTLSVALSLKVIGFYWTRTYMNTSQISSFWKEKKGEKNQQLANITQTVLCSWYWRYLSTSATVWLTDVILLVFEQLWSSTAQGPDNTCWITLLLVFVFSWDWLTIIKIKNQTNPVSTVLKYQKLTCDTYVMWESNIGSTHTGHTCIPCMTKVSLTI